MSLFSSQLCADYWDFSPDPSFSFDLSAEEDDRDGEGEWEFETALDERVCSICAALDGSVFSDEELDGNFNVSEVDEETVAANIHMNCRCTLYRVESE